jgi:hypothetical protein
VSAPETAPDPGDWEVVAEVSDIYEGELVAGRLRSAGMDARVVDQSFRQEPIPSVRSFAVVRVFVPRDRVEEAERILVEPAPSPRDGESEEP